MHGEDQPILIMNSLYKNLKVSQILAYISYSEGVLNIQWKAEFEALLSAKFQTITTAITEKAFGDVKLFFKV